MVNSSSRKVKAVWTPALHKIFVDSCLEQRVKGNRPGTHFTKEGWMNLAESLNKKAGLRFDKKQLKNHWDGTKEQWKIWCKLIGTGHMKWDPETSTFAANDEDWAKYLQANPEAAQFRIKRLQHTDKLEIVFDFTIHNGEVDPPRRKRLIDSSSTLLAFKEEPDIAKTDGNNKCLGDAAMVQPISCRAIASEQSVCSSSLKRPKAIWTPSLHKIFIDLCVEQTLQGNRPRTHFIKEGWMNIVQSFYEKTGVSYDRMQLKNHWDATKEQWKVWCKLVGTSNMKWDPNTNRFGASEEDWVNYVQAKPDAAQFRFKEFPHTDKLAIIFDGAINTGETEPPVQRRKLNDGSATSLLPIDEPVTPKSGRTTENVCDAVESKSAVTVQSTLGKLSYSIGECIECLDGMEDIEQGSELYLYALDIFLKKEYREIFLQLKKPSVRIAWLQRLFQSANLPLH